MLLLHMAVPRGSSYEERVLHVRGILGLAHRDLGMVRPVEPAHHSQIGRSADRERPVVATRCERSHHSGIARRAGDRLRGVLLAERTSAAHEVSTAVVRFLGRQAAPSNPVAGVAQLTGGAARSHEVAVRQSRVVRAVPYHRRPRGAGLDRLPKRHLGQGRCRGADRSAGRRADTVRFENGTLLSGDRRSGLGADADSGSDTASWIPRCQVGILHRPGSVDLPNPSAATAMDAQWPVLADCCAFAGHSLAGRVGTHQGQFMARRRV